MDAGTEFVQQIYKVHYSSFLPKVRACARLAGCFVQQTYKGHSFCQRCVRICASVCCAVRCFMQQTYKGHSFLPKVCACACERVLCSSVFCAADLQRALLPAKGVCVCVRVCVVLFSALCSRPTQGTPSCPRCVCVCVRACVVLFGVLCSRPTNGTPFCPMCVCVFVRACVKLGSRPLKHTPPPPCPTCPVGRVCTSRTQLWKLQVACSLLCVGLCKWSGQIHTHVRIFSVSTVLPQAVSCIPPIHVYLCMFLANP